MFRFVNNIPVGKRKLVAVAIREKCMRTATIGPDLRLKTEHTATAKTLHSSKQGAILKQQYFGHYFASWNSFALKLLKLFFSFSF